MPRRVLILEDNRDRRLAFAAALGRILPSHELTVTPTVPGFIAAFRDLGPEVELISLDHDLNPLDPAAGDGHAAALHLASLPPTCPIILHTTNELGAHNMTAALAPAWPLFRVRPSNDVAWIGEVWLPRICRLLEHGWIMKAK